MINMMSTSPVNEYGITPHKNSKHVINTLKKKTNLHLHTILLLHSNLYEIVLPPIKFQFVVLLDLLKFSNCTIFLM